MISVEIPAPYLSLQHLVSAIAQAVARASRSSAELVNIEEAEALAAVKWESNLRALAESRAIKGHHRESLAAEEWVFLDVERDAFFVDDLNACKQLSEAGLRFVVAEDQRERAEFTAFLIEATNNDAEINWQYWVDQMPTISAADAARLLAGLDPDQYADLNRRPVPQNNVDGACKKAMQFERLATAEHRSRATPDEWLEWARERSFQVHCGFEMAVEDKRAREALVAALNALPQKEADHWRNAHPVEDGRRLVTYMFAGHQSAGHFSLASFVGEVNERLSRWKDGSYFILEAAQLLADSWPNIDAQGLYQQMEDAIRTCALKLRWNDVPLSKDDIPQRRLWNLSVREADVNEWLASTGARFRLHFPYADRDERCRVGGYDVNALADECTAPESTQAEPQSAPAMNAKEKPRTWWDVSSAYIVEVMQAGQYATCKELYRALGAKAGADGPFDRGEGANRGSLFVREIARPLSLKTVQNKWQALRELARK